MWLLEALGKMRFLTTTQVARLAFGGSRWAGNKRLRKLLDAGLVRAWVRDLADDNVYSLDRAGARVLGGVNGDPGPWTVPRGLDGNLDHLLTINQVRIRLALELAEAGGELAWWRSDWELRAHGREPVIPDALFAISWKGAGVQAFALEVDNQTRSPRAFLKKLLKYCSVRFFRRGLYGVPDFLVLVVGVDPKWVGRYLALGRTQETWRIWFTTLDAVEKKGAVGPIWTPEAGEWSRSLRDLSFLPYGKEGFVLGTPTLRES